MVRHPLYAGEALAGLGLLLQYFSLGAVALWLVHISLQLSRMRFEERLLRDTSPEYAGYAARTAAIVPGLY